jgi:hypothetical protein
LIAVGLVSIERLLELGRGRVDEVVVKALGVVPLHPSERGEFEVFDCLPRPRARGTADEFGLVVTVDGLGQGVVVAVCDGVVEVEVAAVAVVVVEVEALARLSLVQP